MIAARSERTRDSTGRSCRYHSTVHDSTYFSDQHIAVRDMVRTFARETVAPVAKQLDGDQEFPWTNVKRMGFFFIMLMKKTNKMS